MKTFHFFSSAIVESPAVQSLSSASLASLKMQYSIRERRFACRSAAYLITYRLTSALSGSILSANLAFPGVYS
jgi:hypothetical protein